MPFQIAFTPNGETALITLLGGTEVLPMTVATRTLLTPIPVPGGTLGIAVAPDGATALVGQVAPPAVRSLDLATDTLGPAVPLPLGVEGTAPQQIAFAGDGTLALVTNPDSNELFPVATPALTLGTTISNGPFTTPTSNFQVAFDATCSPAVPVTSTTTAAPAVAAAATPSFTG